MGIEHIDWALRKVDGVDANIKIILATLGNYADETGCCWPAIPSIARSAALSESTVRRHLRWLTEQGAMTIESRHSSRGRQQSNVYRINLAWRGPTSPDPATGRENANAQGCQIDTPVPVIVTGIPVTSDTPSPVTGDTPTTLNHQSEPSGNKEEESRALEIEFQKLVAVFDPGPTESLQRGRLALGALSADDRQLAIKHAPDFVRAVASEKRKLPSIATYLAERRWEAVVRQAAKRPSERTGGKVFVRRDSDVWDLWAKHLSKDPRALPTLHSREYACVGWYFGSTLYPPKQNDASENAA